MRGTRTVHHDRRTVTPRPDCDHTCHPTPASRMGDDPDDRRRPDDAASVVPVPGDDGEDDTGFVLRPALPTDAELLWRLTYEAVNWRGDDAVPPLRLRADPSLSHYVDGWMRPGDVGVVAVAAGEPVGSCWARVFDRRDPGYGFVADDVPELSLAVLAPARGLGIGRALLTACVDRVRSGGSPGVSLSVESGNRAAASLYRSVGFRTVGHVANADTMLLGSAPVDPARPAPS